MEYDLHLSPEALRSIDEQMIWFEESEGNWELADRWLAILHPILAQIPDNPEQNGFAPENGRWRAEVIIRQKRFRPWKGKPGWRILYTSDQSRHTVTVLQIRHERRPWLGR